MPIDKEDNKGIESVSLANTTDERRTTDPYVRFEQDDLVEEDKISLGSHLSKISREPKNNQQYTIGNNNSVTEISIRTATGLPAPVVTDPNNELNKTFFNSTLIGTDNEKLKTRFEQNSDSQFFNIDGNGVGFNIIKGKSTAKNDKSITFETLMQLEGIGVHKVNEAVSIRQKETSRFSSDNLYIDPSIKATEKNSGVSSFVIQKEFGSHSPTAKFLVGDNSSNNASSTDVITIDQLKNIGIQMMIKSSGEFYKPHDETDDKYASMTGRTLVPSLARLGQRVNYEDFSAGRIMEQVNPNYSKPNNPSLANDGDETRQKKSFGSPYNPIVPFDGFYSDVAALTAATAMMLGITGVVLGLSQFFGADKVQNFVRRNSSQTNGSNSTYEPHIRMLGQGSNGSKLPKQTDQGPRNLIGGIVGDRENLLGLVATKNEYKDCVKKGLNIFFNPKNQDSRNIVLTSPNYANTILRTISRDLVDVGFGIASIAGNSNMQGSLEVESSTNRDPQNAAATVDSTFRMITQLKENRLIKFMNILALLGDAVLTGDKVEQYTDQAAGSLMKDNSESTTFGNNISMKNFHKKSRLSNQVNKNAGSLAWSNNTIKSMYLKPKEIGIASQVYLNNQNAVAELTNKNYFVASDTNRIDSDLVEQLEEELGKSYMPFYFHDLRTNEIISFHAFLDSVSDGFDASYTETEAYGRLGSVYKWQNTKRNNISLNFWMISTNPSDFDEMWLKVNKLTMLTMPQYTEGRSLTHTSNQTTYKFTQPFSQLPSNSPMVRMRLGDFFKTNYSEFDLARLFGIGNSKEFQVNNGGANTLTEEKQNSIGTKIKNSDFESKISSLFEYVNNGFSGESLVRAGVAVEQLSYELQQDFFSYGNVNGKTIYRPISVAQNIIEDATKPLRIKPAGTLLRGTVSSDATVPDAIRIGVDYYVLNGMPSALIRPSAGTIQSIINSSYTNSTSDVNATVSPETINLITSFFSKENNAIFKAFESTKGEGVPGFVASVKFDSEAGTMWNTGEEAHNSNRQAPTMLKVSIEFKPIFDLNPGLDSNGFMIGAPYNIGKIMKQLKNPDGTPTQRTASTSGQSPVSQDLSTGGPPLDSTTGTA